MSKTPADLCMTISKNVSAMYKKIADLQPGDLNRSEYLHLAGVIKETEGYLDNLMDVTNKLYLGE